MYDHLTHHLSLALAHLKRAKDDLPANPDPSLKLKINTSMRKAESALTQIRLSNFPKEVTKGEKP